MNLEARLERIENLLNLTDQIETKESFLENVTSMTLFKVIYGGEPDAPTPQELYDRLKNDGCETKENFQKALLNLIFDEYTK
jgi:hypothetical protein